MFVIRWIRSVWYAHLRRIDVAILWEYCKKEAPDLDHAKAAFAIHCANDSSWMILGEEEVIRRINDLE